MASFGRRLPEDEFVLERPVRLKPLYRAVVRENHRETRLGVPRRRHVANDHFGKPGLWGKVCLLEIPAKALPLVIDRDEQIGVGKENDLADRRLEPAVGGVGLTSRRLDGEVAGEVVNDHGASASAGHQKGLLGAHREGRNSHGVPREHSEQGLLIERPRPRRGVASGRKDLPAIRASEERVDSSRMANLEGHARRTAGGELAEAVGANRQGGGNPSRDLKPLKLQARVFLKKSQAGREVGSTWTVERVDERV